ncbi:MAG TPA: hypothetical protein VHI52_20675 [Verrucomicrobiae bacterium]|nr:hypothetical protein [Verrucomicrobiae bacterium]
MPQQKFTPLDKIRSAIQLAGFHYVACLKAIPTNADHRLKIEKMEFVFEAISRTDSRTLRGEFQRWAGTVVLRDVVESFSTFLTEIYQSVAEANPAGSLSVKPSQFERKGIEDQLAVLASDFDIDPAWIMRLVGYNRARNCLAHRQGLVGSRDVTEGKELVVRWLASKVETTDGEATPYIEATGPMSSLIRGVHVHGKAALLEIYDKEKRIEEGSVLNFLPGDILEILQTFHTAAAAFDGLTSQRVS